MYHYIQRIDLIDDIEKYDVILIGTNCYCAMNNGFQGKVRKKYNFVYDLNLSTKYGDKNKLGKNKIQRKIFLKMKKIIIVI